MDFYKELENKTEEEVKEITSRKIDELEKIAEERRKKLDDSIIGYKLDYNPEQKEITLNGDEEEFTFEARCYHPGYISKNAKIVFGIKYNYAGEICNDGQFYYLEDDSYIYEFCDFIKDKDVEDEYDIMHYILVFMLDYFKKIWTIDRETMYSLIHKDGSTNYPPIRKHLLTDFKGKGNALCSEYAVMAQNLMSIFGIHSSLVIGAEKVNGTNLEPHAYNIVELQNTETEERKAYITDFLNYIRTYDIEFEVMDIMPFLGGIGELNSEFLKSLLHEKEEFTFEDYAYQCIGNIPTRITLNRERTYFVDDVIKGEKILMKKH